MAMRKIEVKKWKEMQSNGEEVDQDLMGALTAILHLKRPEEMPKGLDLFRLFSRVGKAFDEAKKTSTLELEDADYAFLKKCVENDIPAVWGTNPSIMGAIEAFLECK